MACEEGGGRSCAVRGCTNTPAGLGEWRQAACAEHRPLRHADCPCLEPYCFYRFPSGRDERGRWLQALRGRGLRVSPGPDPGCEAAVCSLHLEEGTLLLGLGLRKKPRADQCPDPEFEYRPGRETRASRARKKRPPSPRRWAQPPPPSHKPPAPSHKPPAPSHKPPAPSHKPPAPSPKAPAPQLPLSPPQLPQLPPPQLLPPPAPQLLPPPAPQLLPPPAPQLLPPPAPQLLPPPAPQPQPPPAPPQLPPAPQLPPPQLLPPPRPQLLPASRPQLPRPQLRQLLPAPPHPQPTPLPQPPPPPPPPPPPRPQAQPAASPSSWEHAAVQAIMRLRCGSSQRVARTLIACLKGENDHLRQRSRQLEAALGATARQLERLQRECRCRHRPGGAEAGPGPDSAEPPEQVPGNEVTVG